MTWNKCFQRVTKEERALKKVMRKIKRALRTLKKAPKEDIRSFRDDVAAIAPNINLVDIFYAQKKRVKEGSKIAIYPMDPEIVLSCITDEELRLLDPEKIYRLRVRFSDLYPGISSNTLNVLEEALGLLEHACEEAHTGESFCVKGAPLMRERYSQKV